MPNSKTKGSRNERGVAKLFQEWTGYEFARTPQSGGLHWKKAHTSGDIVCIDVKHAHRFPFSIECKFYAELEFHHFIDSTKGKKSNKILEFWKQAVNDALVAHKIPLLFMRKNGMVANTHFVVIDAGVFSTLDQSFQPLKYGYMGYISKDYKLIILNSEDFFSWDYTSIRKKLRNVANSKT